MLIALDYDQTYTRDPDLWDRFIVDARKQGHDLVCITSRTYEPGSTKSERVPAPAIRFLCAGSEMKADVARKAGLNVAIWIDDMPASISQIPLL